MACGICWSVYFLYHNFGKFLNEIFRYTSFGNNIIIWRHDIWPIQWRIAISWLSTYFTTQLFVPILFQISGPVVAGQMGMTITLCNVLIAVSSNWIVTKGPQFGVLIANKYFKKLDKLFYRSLFVSTIVAVFCSLSAWLIIYLLNIIKIPIATRILPPLPAAMMFLASIFISIINSLSIYLRAHKKEPLSGICFISTILISLLAIILATRFNAIGVVMSYLGVLVLFQLPISIIIFRRFRLLNHKEAL